MRQILDELYIGQKVLVRPNPTAYPMEAFVTAIDSLKGMVHVNLRDYQGKWAVKPRAISNLAGKYLHYQQNQFYFSPEPFFAS